MTERLLQYIWQFQYFNGYDLTTITGERLQIIAPGTFNSNQGPDFAGGRIKLNGHIWVGSIELHVYASDWRRHLHQHDVNYNNVILHVVWIYDDGLDDTTMPTLELASRVPKLLLQQYMSWMKSDQFIPCGMSIGMADKLIVESWKDRLLIERIERKREGVMLDLKKNKFHWEEVMWWMLARNFGLYVNADAFGNMARSIPLGVLSKHRMQIHQVEALLFGQCGLLDFKPPDKYSEMLVKEYGFLKRKYGLIKNEVRVNFLRMRPACFPTVRLAQLSMVMHTTENIFSLLKDAADIGHVKNLLNVTANDYWHYHFRFGEPTVYQPKTLGAVMINSIIVNTVIVMLFVYGKYRNEEAFTMKALKWMEELQAEKNTVIAGFRRIGLTAANARDSQALIEMKSQYCDQKRCLDCAIANNVLKRNAQPTCVL